MHSRPSTVTAGKGLFFLLGAGKTKGRNLRINKIINIKIIVFLSGIVNGRADFFKEIVIVHKLKRLFCT